MTHNERLREKYSKVNSYNKFAIDGSTMNFNNDYVLWLEAYCFVLQRELDKIIETVKLAKAAELSKQLPLDNTEG